MIKFFVKTICIIISIIILPITFTIFLIKDFKKSKVQKSNIESLNIDFH